MLDYAVKKAIEARKNAEAVMTEEPKGVENLKGKTVSTSKAQGVVSDNSEKYGNGNIILDSIPQKESTIPGTSVKNPFTVYVNGNENKAYLIPAYTQTVAGYKPLSQEEAEEQYRNTGKYFDSFDASTGEDWLRKNGIQKEKMLSTGDEIIRNINFQKTGSVLSPQEQFENKLKGEDRTVENAIENAEGGRDYYTGKLFAPDTYKSGKATTNINAGNFANKVGQEKLVKHMQKNMENPLYAGVLLAGSVMDNVWAVPVEAVENALDSFSAGEYIPYRDDASVVVNAIRGTAAQAIAGKIENKTGSEFAGKLAANTFQAVMSAADSTLGAFTMGKAYTVAMGMSAAESRAKKLYEEGATDSQIIKGAIASGIAETVFEEISLDKLIKAGDSKTIKELTVNIGKQAFTEGSEELFTDIANNITDAIIRGNNSDISKNTLKERVQDYLWSFYGGAVSGGMSATGAGTFGITKYNAQLNGIGRSVLADEEARGAAIEQGLDQAHYTQMYKTAEKMQNGEKVSAKAVGEMVLGCETPEAMKARLLDHEVRRSAEEQGVADDITDKVADISAVTGRRIYFTQSENLMGNTGYYDMETGVILLNAEAKIGDLVDFVVKHELTHSVEGTDGWNIIRDFVRRDIGDMESAIDEEIKTRAENGITLDREGAEAEIIADWVGKNLYKENFAERITKRSGALGNQFLDVLDKIRFALGTNGAKVRSLEKTFAKAILHNSPVVQNGNWISELATYDDEGNIISLSEKFRTDGTATQENEKPTVRTDGGKFAIKYNFYSEDELKRNCVKLQKMKSVVTISGKEMDFNGKKLEEKVDELFSSVGYNVYTDEFGDVALNTPGIKSDVHHGLTKNKIASFVAIPDVLKNGVVIFSSTNGKGKNDRIVCAAKIKIEDKPFVMGVMLLRDDKSQRLYVHDVITINREESTNSSNEVLSTTGSKEENGKLFLTTILHNALNVKKKFGFYIKKGAKVNEELLEELSIHHPEAEVDTDGKVTVYHRTSRENAESIKKTGIMTAKEDALFFSSKESGYADGYGDSVIKLKIPSTVLEVNDIFDGEVHFDIPLRYQNGGFRMNVSNYLVEDSFENKNDNIKFSDEGREFLGAEDTEENRRAFREGKSEPSKTSNLRESIDEIDDAFDTENEEWLGREKKKEEKTNATKRDSYTEVEQWLNERDRVEEMSRDDIANAISSIAKTMEEIEDATEKDAIQRVKKLAKEAQKLAEFGDLNREELIDLYRNLSKRVEKIAGDFQIATAKSEKQYAKYTEWKDSAERRKLRERIIKTQERFQSLLEHPTKEKHIPVELVGAIRDFIGVGMESREDIEGRILDLRRELRETVDEKKRETLQKKINSAKNKLQNLDKHSVMLSAVVEEYRKAVKSDERTGAMEEFIPYLEQLNNIVGDRNLTELGQWELKEVLKIFDAVHTQINNANKFISDEYKEDIDDTAKQFYAEIMANKEMTPQKRFIRAQTMWLLSPERFFENLSGWKVGSVGSEIAKELTDAEMKELEINREYRELFAEYMESGEYDKATDYKDLVDIGLKDAGGNPVMMTRSMMLGMYENLLCNRVAVMDAGITVPDMKLYYKGQKQEAFANGKKITVSEIAEALYEAYNAMGKAQTKTAQNEASKRITELMKVANQDMDRIQKNIEEKMTEQEKRLVGHLRKWFDEISKGYINKATMETMGYEIARVKTYYPIARNKDFLKTGVEGVAYDFSIENSGNLKERVRSKIPLLIYDVFDVLEKSGNTTAKIGGWMKFNRDFGNIFSWSDLGTERSIRTAIAKRFGAGNRSMGVTGIKYIENLLEDINGARKKEGDSPWAIFRRNAIRGTLTFNLRVAISQAASYPTAAAVVGWDNIAKGLKHLGKIDKAEYQAILDNSILFWERARGNGGSEEIHAVRSGENTVDKAFKWMDDKTKGYLFNWCQKVDVKTVATLWFACKSKVQSEHKGLTAEELNKRAGELLNEVIRKTQPNFTMAERSDLLRDNREIMKVLTMYKTQSIQNINILYESVARHKAAKAQFEAGKITEAQFTEAKRGLANGYTALIVGMATFALMRVLVNLLMHRTKDYRNKDNELNAGGIALGVGKEMMSGFAGMVPFGDTVNDVVMSVVFGDKFYPMSDSGISTAMSIIENIAGGSFLKSPASFNYMMQDLCSTMGIPYKNIADTIKGFVYHIEDIRNGEFLSFNAGYNISDANYYSQLYKAMKKGNTERAQNIRKTLLESGKTESQIEAGLRSSVKRNDEGFEKQMERILRDIDGKQFYKKLSEAERKKVQSTIESYIADEIFAENGGTLSKAHQKDRKIMDKGVKVESYYLAKEAKVAEASDTDKDGKVSKEEFQKVIDEYFGGNKTLAGLKK